MATQSFDYDDDEDEDVPSLVMQTNGQDDWTKAKPLPTEPTLILPIGRCSMLRRSSMPSRLQGHDDTPHNGRKVTRWHTAN